MAGFFSRSSGFGHPPLRRKLTCLERPHLNPCELCGGLGYLQLCHSKQGPQRSGISILWGRESESQCAFFKKNYFIFAWTKVSVVATLRPSLWCVGPFICSKRTLSCSMWDLIPCPGMEPGPPALGAWSLSRGPQGSSSVCILTSSQVTTLKVLGFYLQHPSLHRNSRDRAFPLQQYKAWAQILHSI